MNEVFNVMEGLTIGSKLLPLYIDPATTSYLIQLGAGAVIAIGTFLGIYRNKIKRFFKKDQNKATPEIEKNDDAKKEVVTADDLMDDED